MPISCILVDDEELALEELHFLLDSVPGVGVVGQGRNGVEAIRLVKELEPDLMFLDIQMPGLNGFQVVRQLVKEEVLPQVIFVTAYDQYAVRAFEVNAVDYILKPVEKSRLEMAIQRARKQLESNVPVDDRIKDLLNQFIPATPRQSKLLVTDRRRHLMIDVDDIVFASVSDGSVQVSTGDLNGETHYRTLEELQANLDPQVFWRVHRSFLVNINRIKEVVPWFNRTLQLKMADRAETEVPVSRSNTRKLKDYLKL